MIVQYLGFIGVSHACQYSTYDPILFAPQYWTRLSCIVLYVGLWCLSGVDRQGMPVSPTGIDPRIPDSLFVVVTVNYHLT